MTFGSVTTGSDGRQRVPLSYIRHRRPVEVISHPVWLYPRFPTSFRDAASQSFQRDTQQPVTARPQHMNAQAENGYQPTRQRERALTRLLPRHHTANLSTLGFQMKLRSLARLAVITSSVGVLFLSVTENALADISPSYNSPLPLDSSSWTTMYGSPSYGPSTYGMGGVTLGWMGNVGIVSKDVYDINQINMRCETVGIPGQSGAGPTLSSQYSWLMPVLHLDVSILGKQANPGQQTNVMQVNIVDWTTHKTSTLKAFNNSMPSNEVQHWNLDLSRFGGDRVQFQLLRLGDAGDVYSVSNLTYYWMSGTYQAVSSYPQCNDNVPLGGSFQTSW